MSEAFDDREWGLGEEEKSDWPVVGVTEGQEPIDALRPGSDLHNRVRDYLVDRIQASERSMSRFYGRWAVQDQKTQAYINLPDWEKQLKQMNDTGAPPKAISLIIPVSFATISVLVTFLLHMFAGRRPMFQLGSYQDESMERARNMEMVIQFQVDYTRLIKYLYQYLQDTQNYGVGVMRVGWEVVERMRSRDVEQLGMDPFGNPIPTTERIRELVPVYEGNKVWSHDPFMFFPDPTVPMHEVNVKGEFVFFRSFEAPYKLKTDEHDGLLKWVDQAGDSIPRMTGSEFSSEGLSTRSSYFGGEPFPGIDTDSSIVGQRKRQVDQGTIWIIPKELGLGHEERPEMWLFTILNKKQIVQAERFDTDHGKHPCCVAEPYVQGYGFGQPGMSDYLGPLQDAISWLFNSHQDNVRKSLNDMFVVDPQRVVMKDLRDPNKAGRLIRLKDAAFGSDVRTAVQQLQVQDVTKGHIDDMQTLFRMINIIAGADENLFGLQDFGGRKTATEVRTAAEAGASRLAAGARLISSQGMVDIVEMMALNNIQRLPDEFYIMIRGEEGLENPIRLDHDAINGTFYFPTHDGTAPLDRVALLDVWKEVLQGVMADPELRINYSVPKLFEHVAELGGARNIESMRIGVASEDSIAGALAGGDLIPAGTGSLPGVNPNPGRRIAGALG